MSNATLADATLSGSIALRDLDTDPIVDLVLGVRHLDFAQLPGTSGLAMPESLGMALGGRDPATSSPCATFRRCSCALCCLPGKKLLPGSCQVSSAIYD
jgi:hypothetical protein